VGAFLLVCCHLHLFTAAVIRLRLQPNGFNGKREAAVGKKNGTKNGQEGATGGWGKWHQWAQ